MTDAAAPATLLALEEGFLALPRRLCGSALFDSLRADERYVIVTMLLRAQWAPGEYYFAGGRFPLAPGQFIDSEEALARAAGSTRKVVRTVYRKTEAAGLVTRTKAHPAGQCPHVTTILGYERILFAAPDMGPRTDPPTGHEGAKNGPADGPRRGQERAPSEQGNKETNVPLPSPAAPARRKREPTDPRFGPLREAWEHLFADERRGEAYRWQGAKDSKALHFLIAVPVAEFEARARRGLRGRGWASCATVAQLATKWNDLVPVPPDARDVRYGMADPGRPGDFEVGELDLRSGRLVPTALRALRDAAAAAPQRDGLYRDLAACCGDDVAGELVLRPPDRFVGGRLTDLHQVREFAAAAIPGIRLRIEVPPPSAAKEALP